MITSETNFSSSIYRLLLLFHKTVGATLLATPVSHASFVPFDPLIKRGSNSSISKVFQLWDAASSKTAASSWIPYNPTGGKKEAATVLRSEEDALSPLELFHAKSYTFHTPVRSINRGWVNFTHRTTASIDPSFDSITQPAGAAPSLVSSSTLNISAIANSIFPFNPVIPFNSLWTSIAPQLPYSAISLPQQLPVEVNEGQSELEPIFHQKEKIDVLDVPSPEDSNKDVSTEGLSSTLLTAVPPVEQESILLKNDSSIILHQAEKQKHEQALPSRPVSRFLQFGGLFVRLAAGTAAESARRWMGRKDHDSTTLSPVLSSQNIQRIGLTLSKMRGAALKLGQMLSIQEEHLPPLLRHALMEVRNNADCMPGKQLFRILEEEWGLQWPTHFKRFNAHPIAAASIGQVHEAWLSDGKKVAIKIQYPGVMESMESDLKNLVAVIKYTKLIPQRLFLDVLCKEIKTELLAECDYENEANFFNLFRDLLASYKGYYIPTIFSSLSTGKILTMEYLHGSSMDDVAMHASQDVRNSVASRLLFLCLQELFVFKVMNTDPNPANYLYNFQTDTLCLMDFGAGRIFPSQFVEKYLCLVYSAALEDYEQVKKYSIDLGFLNGAENSTMIDAHVSSVVKVGEPFQNLGYYDFGASTIVEEIYNLAPTMLQHRLKPPPPEAYSLHRKLAGCYLLCMKLKAHVNAHQMFFDILTNFTFVEEVLK